MYFASHSQFIPTGQLSPNERTPAPRAYQTVVACGVFPPARLITKRTLEPPLTAVSPLDRRPDHPKSTTVVHSHYVHERDGQHRQPRMMLCSVGLEYGSFQRPTTKLGGPYACLSPCLELCDVGGGNVLGR